MVEEAATGDSDDEELIDELPEGDEGWEYMENGSSDTDGGSDKDIGENQRDIMGNGEEIEEDGERTEDKKKKAETEASVEALERAVADDAPGYEIERAVTEADLGLVKGDIVGFVRKTEADVSGTAFVPGEDWDGVDDGFSELGWVENDELTAVGASLLAYAGDVIDEAGDQAALIGYLNSVGVDVFVKEALQRGPDDEGDGDGFIGGLLG